MAGILIEIKDLRKSYGERTVLSVDRLTVYDGERVGLIGENGAGKSTLLSILSGDVQPDSGSVRRFGPVSLIRQFGDSDTVPDRRERAEMRAPDFREGLSGGEHTRRRIASAFSENAALLMADEPTSDLDADGIERLTEKLESFPGALLLVSHDRNLLNRICDRILYLEDGHITDFPGNYADFQAQRQRERDRAQFEYDRYKAEKARLKASAQKKAEWASSVKKAPSRMGNSEARLHTRESTNAVLQLSHQKKTIQNRIDHLEKKERPRDLPDISMDLGLANPIRAARVLHARCEVLSAGETVLLRDTELWLPTGSHTALMGANGSGKTTLLRVLNRTASDGVDFAGGIRFNPGVRLGFFDQDHEKTLDIRRSVLDNVLEDSSLGPVVARNVLARLNLRGDDVFKPVSVLSGGERAKVALTKLLLSDLNLLILDEPTNHLDLFTLEALQELLKGYGGTVLFVSHDREFTEQCADRILEIRDRRIVTREGTLSETERDTRERATKTDNAMEISLLEMRMAGLAARMSAPKKGDDPMELNRQYEELAARLRELK